jgi:hypothetical protein
VVGIRDGDELGAGGAIGRGCLEGFDLAVRDDLLGLSPDDEDRAREGADVTDGISGKRLLEPFEARGLDLAERGGDLRESIGLGILVVALEGLGSTEE